MAAFSERYKLVNGETIESFDADQFDMALSEWMEACRFSPTPVKLIDTFWEVTAEASRRDTDLEEKGEICRRLMDTGTPSAQAIEAHKHGYWFIEPRNAGAV